MGVFDVKEAKEVDNKQKHNKVVEIEWIYTYINKLMSVNPRSKELSNSSSKT